MNPHPYGRQRRERRLSTPPSIRFPHLTSGEGTITISDEESSSIRVIYERRATRPGRSEQVPPAPQNSSPPLLNIPERSWVIVERILALTCVRTCNCPCPEHGPPSTPEGGPSPHLEMMELLVELTGLHQCE